MRLIAVLLVFALGLTAAAQQFDQEARATIEITRYVEDWSKNLPRSHRRAMRHVPIVAHWATEYEVDPLLVAVIVSLESSWKVGATGARGELGLMQFHADKAKAGFDLTVPDEQVHAGTRWLRICIDTCGGDAEQGLNNYATGSCTAPWSGLAYRLRHWRRAVRLFRDGPDVAPAQDGGTDEH